MPLRSNLSIRAYTPADDAACKLLEVTASQFQSVGGLIKAAITHNGGFDGKALQYESHVLLVCFDSACDAVCGVIVCAIKTVTVHGQERRIGFVSDLRVDEKYQRQGIGEALAQEVEARASAQGVTFLVLSVNNDNRKAKQLYSKLGWHMASARNLSFRPLLSLPADPSRGKILVEQLEHEAALSLTAKHYGKRDLGLTAQEFRRLFSASQLLGTYFATDGAGSQAALSLWHGSTISNFTPLNLFLPVRVWKRIFPLLATAACAAAAAGAYALLGAAGRVGGPIAQAAVGLPCAAVAGAVGYFVNFINTRTAFRARAFAPVVSGPAWQPLMRAVHARVCTEARRQGFGVIVINEDMESEMVACLGAGKDASKEGDVKTKTKKKAPTSFWQKHLVAAGGASDAQAMLKPDAFFDPRDI